MYFTPQQTTRAINIRRDIAPVRYARLFLALLMAASLVSIGLLNAARAATAGDLDPTFSGDGKVTTSFSDGDGISAIAIQPDGKIVAVGGTRGSGVPGVPLQDTDFAVARYNSNGQLDQSFGAGGKVTTNISWLDQATDVVIQPDGKILVAGTTRIDAYSRYSFAFARYNPNGSRDLSFGNGGVLTYSGLIGYGAEAVALLPDGKFVAVGTSVAIGNNQQIDFALVRFNSDGSDDDGSANDSTPGDSFGEFGMASPDILENGGSHATDMVLQPDGKFLVVGYRSDATHSDVLLARYNSDGSLDQSFGTGGVSTGNFPAVFHGSVALQPDGKIVLAGYTGSFDQGNVDFALARYKSDGQPDQSFGTGGKATTDFFGGDDVIVDAVVQPDGKIVAVGVAREPGDDPPNIFGHTYFALARYNSNGRLDPGFGTGGKKTIDFTGKSAQAVAVALQPDGKIVAGGSTATSVEFDSDFAVARFLNDASSIIPHLASLTINSPVASGCGTVTGVVTLDGPAPSGGVYVALSSTNEAASVPTRIKVAAGETTRSFTIKVMAGTSTEAGNIIARLGTSTRAAQLVVKPIGVSSVTLNPNPVEGPDSVTAVVTLSCPAPEGGISVMLSSSNPTVANPILSSITIPEGLQVKSFTVRTSDVPATRTVTIRATANGVSKSAVLMVR
jgi:uncharacterized delta-60 repeat protein